MLDAKQGVGYLVFSVGCWQRYCSLGMTLDGQTDSIKRIEFVCSSTVEVP